MSIIGEPLSENPVFLDHIAGDLEKAGAFKPDCGDIVAIGAGILLKRINHIKSVTDEEIADEGWKEDPYAHGMANGLILSVNILNETTPNFLNMTGQTYTKSVAETLGSMLKEMGDDKFVDAIVRMLAAHLKLSKSDVKKRALSELLSGS